MTKTFSFLSLFFFLFLASCGKGGGGGSSSKGNAQLTDTNTNTGTELNSTEVPVEAETFDVNAKLSGFERDQEEKIFKAIELIKKVIASDDFKNHILRKTYNGKKRFVDNGGLTNAQIYKKILEGAEKLHPVKNNAMDIKVESYFETANVIGYTMPSIKTIYINTRYLDKESFATNQVAMNLTHEWLHKLGFKHAAKRTDSRPHSVPYAIGYIMRTLADKLN